MIELDFKDVLETYAASEVDTYELKHSILQDDWQLREQLVYELNLGELVTDQAISRKLLEENITDIKTNLIKMIGDALASYSENKDIYDS